MALVGFSASAVQALTYQNGDYMGSLNKKASGAQCFIMALGLFWDIITGLPWTPNGVGSLEPRGYCIFLPGAHYLTINSPYGADSLLNKLLLLLLLQLVLILYMNSLFFLFFPILKFWDCHHDVTVTSLWQMTWSDTLLCVLCLLNARVSLP